MTANVSDKLRPTPAAPPDVAERGAQVTTTAGQHSLGRSVLLHLYPGLALATFVVLTAPTFESWGLPALFALIIGIGVVITPLELGYLSLHAHRTTGSWSPLSAVDYRTRLRVRRLLLVGGGLAAFMMTFVVAHMLVLDRLISPLFSWMPATLFQFASMEAGDPLVGGGLALMVVALLLLNGIVGPVTEELYFRGHLLPRIDRYGRWAPVLNTALFTLYHMWTPWRWPQVFFGFLPASWLAWRKRTVWLPMTMHVIVNLIFSLLLIALFLEAAS
jgi:uncharacterized protein